MKNLGKILLFISLLVSTLFAVNAKITPRAVYVGDRISLILSTHGNDIEFPILKEIAGYKIESQSISRNITNINGKVTKTLSKEYIFTPQKSFTVPAFEVEVDGKIETTKTIKVEVKKETANKAEAFIFTLKADKSEAYIGEPINVVFTFKKHLDIKLAEANFDTPTFHDFWAKPMKKEPAAIEGAYQVYRIHYLLFAQKEGNITIEPGRMDAGIMQTRKRDFFNFERVKWKSLFSNEIVIDVKPLPAGADIYGDFKMSVTVDKQKTKANEPVNLTVTIKGIGNVDDIEEYKLDIKDAIVYADKPQRKIYTNNKEELGEFTQKFAIVSDRNFTIEPLEFTFFSSEEKEVKHLKSEQFDIEVTASSIKTQTAKLEKKEQAVEAIPKTKIIYDKASQTKLILFTLGGFLLGVLSMFLYSMPKRGKKEHSELPLAKRIKKSKNDKELLALLLPFIGKSQKIKSMIRALEENVYEKKENKIDKIDLIKNIEKYLIKEKDIEDILK
jgi:hypothetical protein